MHWNLWLVSLLLLLLGIHRVCFCVETDERSAEELLLDIDASNEECSESQNCNTTAEKQNNYDSVTLVTAAVDAGRTQHYSGIRYSFHEDYLDPLCLLLQKKRPIVIFMNDKPDHFEYLKSRHCLHDKVHIRVVGNLAEEFKHSSKFPIKGVASDGSEWGKWERILSSGNYPSSCSQVPFCDPSPGQVQWVHFLKPYWLQEVARKNPFATDKFLWLDNNMRCDSWMNGPITFEVLGPKLNLGKLVVFGAKDNFLGNKCIGGTNTTEYSKGFEPNANVLIRGLMFGGTREAIDNAIAIYDGYFEATMPHGNWVYSEEWVLTALYHQNRSRFTMIPTFDNSININLETVSCWPKQLISRDRPTVVFEYPTEGMQIPEESPLFILNVSNWELGETKGLVCLIVEDVDTGDVVFPLDGADDFTACSHESVRLLPLPVGNLIAKAELCHHQGQPVTSSIQIRFSVAPANSLPHDPVLYVRSELGELAMDGNLEASGLGAIVGSQNSHAAAELATAILTDTPKFRMFFLDLALLSIKPRDEDSNSFGFLSVIMTQPSTTTTTESVTLPWASIVGPFAGRILWLNTTTWNHGRVSLSHWMGDNSLSLVYIDEFPQQQDPQALLSGWFGKLQPKGVLAGSCFYDGYRLQHPHNVHEQHSVHTWVNEFAARNNLQLHTTSEQADRSWFIIKPII